MIAEVAPRSADRVGRGDGCRSGGNCCGQGGTVRCGRCATGTRLGVGPGAAFEVGGQARVDADPDIERSGAAAQVGDGCADFRRIVRFAGKGVEEVAGLKGEAGVGEQVVLDAGFFFGCQGE